MVEKREKGSTKLIIQEKPELENPIFIEGLTGIGHIGRTVVSYLIDHFEAVKFAELLSDHFPHWAIVDENKQLDILKNELYYLKGEGNRDMVLLVGDAQSLDPQGHYEIAHSLIDFAKELGVEEMVTIGGYGTGEPIDEPDVYGVVNHEGLRENYEEYKINFNHSVGQIIGATGLLLGIGEREEMDGIALLGETPGFLVSDPKATEAVLKVIEEMLDLDIDYENLEEKIKESEEVIKKIKQIHDQVKNQQKSSQKKEESKDLGYIG